MSTVKSAIMACLLLAACDGNPFASAPDTGTGGTDSGGINTDHALPPGTENPSASGDIVRREAKDDTGNGYVDSVSYDSVNDTFQVDGLAFDGANVYQRGTAVGSLGSYAVYEGDSTYSDDVTGVPIDQFAHRALYGVSTTGKTQFAVIRTGGYMNYGFGGFIYERDGTVTLPTSGQAHYTGDYAGLRDFNGQTGIEYSQGLMTIDIDFNDFSTGAGVRGSITDRSIYDVNGNDITQDVIDALNVGNSTPLTELPVLTFVVDPTALDSNGELTAGIDSSYSSSGTPTTLESGQYYAIVAGDDASEIVGIVVVESTDPRYTGVTVRETGGFILYRE